MTNTSAEIRKIVTDALSGSILTRPLYSEVSMQVVTRISDGVFQIKARAADDNHGPWTYITVSVKREL